MDSHSNYLVFDSNNGVWQHILPGSLCDSQDEFEDLWRLHPKDFPTIFLHGREVKLPRWQQAYGRDYHFSGKSSKALPVPRLLEPYLSWAREKIDDRLNGLLLNWYDDELGHYIGAHRDSQQGLITDSHIVMISLGGTRVMRFRPIKKSSYQDVEIKNGSVLTMNLQTNHYYKHEVPKLKRYQGRRISITLRCFEPVV